MHDRSEWRRGEVGPVTIGKKTYKNLIEFTRNCQTCNEPFPIYVTSKIANGHADSNSFGLKNCPAHRRNRTATDEQEIETLRTANVTMREELTGLYEQMRTQFEELQVCKAKLAQYELGPALWQAQNGTTTASSLPTKRNYYPLGQEQKVT
jgi:hypothetical protein